MPTQLRDKIEIPEWLFEGAVAEQCLRSKHFEAVAALAMSVDLGSIACAMWSLQFTLVGMDNNNIWLFVDLRNHNIRESEQVWFVQLVPPRSKTKFLARKAKESNH